MRERTLLVDQPLSRLIIRVRFPRTFKLRTWAACRLMKLAARIGGFKGIVFEKS